LLVEEALVKVTMLMAAEAEAARGGIEPLQGLLLILATLTM
jgi:hypothetical protein